jgi:hypothetical protein
MLGTILIVILVLALLGALPRTVEIGVMRRPGAWASFLLLFSYSCCSGVSRLQSRRPTASCCKKSAMFCRSVDGYCAPNRPAPFSLFCVPCF